jgi:hypothetical protein
MIPKQVSLKAGRSIGFSPVLDYVMRADDPKAEIDFGVVNYDAIRSDAPGLAEELGWEMNGREDEYRSNGGRGGNPVYHLVMSWKDGEHPTPAQAQAACEYMMNAMDMGGNQAAWALHHDTDHDHLHLVINRIRDDGRMAEIPAFSKIRMHKAAREIELMQGWQADHGVFVTIEGEHGPEVRFMSRRERAERGMLKGAEGPRLSNAARAAEHRNAGAQSFQEWVASTPAKPIKAMLANPGATWGDLHRAAAEYGVTIQPKGSGMIVTTTLDDGRVLAAKASQMGRWASKAELEKRLGPYQPPGTALPAPSLTYQRVLDADMAQGTGQRPNVRAESAERTTRRVERQVARRELAARFKVDQELLRRERPVMRHMMVSRHVMQRKALSAALRQEKPDAIAKAKASGFSHNMAQSLWAMEAAKRREELQKRQAAERKALTAKVPRSEVWRTWLDRQAEAGDEAARAALRGIRYRDQRKKSQGIDGIEGEELDPLGKLTVAALQAEVDQRRQMVIYRKQDGHEAFTDTGPRIVMHDKADDSLEAALRIAAQKYGGKVDITGSSEFRERAAREAVRLGIEVANTDLQEIVMDAQRKAPASPPIGRSAGAAARSVHPDGTQEEASRRATLELRAAVLERQAAQEAHPAQGAASVQPVDGPARNRRSTQGKGR